MVPCQWESEVLNLMSEFDIQEIDDSQIARVSPSLPRRATARQNLCLKSVDCTKMRLTVKLNMLPDLAFLQLYFIILVM